MFSGDEIWIVVTIDETTGKLFSPTHEDGSLHGFDSEREAIEAGNELGVMFYAVCPHQFHTRVS